MAQDLDTVALYFLGGMLVIAILAGSVGLLEWRNRRRQTSKLRLVASPTNRTDDPIPVDTGSRAANPSASLTQTSNVVVATPPPSSSEHPITKRCPYCAEDIKSEAIVCRYCGHDVRVPPNPPTKPAALAPTQKAGDQSTIEETSSGNRRTLQIVLSLLGMPFILLAAIYLWIGWTANRDGYPFDYVLSQFLMMLVFLAIGGVLAWIASKINPR